MTPDSKSSPSGQTGDPDLEHLRKDPGFEQLRALWQAAGPEEMPVPDYARLEAGLKRKMEAARRPAKAAKGRLRPAMFFRWASAASLLIGAIAALWVGLIDSPKPRRFVTQVGENKLIELSDQSKVEMNAATTITLDPNFGSGHRSLTFDGEGLFTIALGESPFLVKTASATVRVLAGEIHVYARQDRLELGTTLGDAEIEVLNGEGSVRERLVLPEKQRAWLADGQWLGEPRPIVLCVCLYPLWKRGIFRYEKMTLDLVVADIERQYGIEIQLQDPAMGQIPVDGLYIGDTAQSLIDHLCMVNGLAFEHEGDSFTIHRLP